MRREYDRRRGSAASRGYGWVWSRPGGIRDQVLQEEPWCRSCLERDVVTPSAEVDHIVSKARGGTDDRANLQALCKPCHSRKTAEEDGRWG